MGYLTAIVEDSDCSKLVENSNGKSSKHLIRKKGDSKICKWDFVSGQPDEVKPFDFVNQCTPTKHYLDRCCGRPINTTGPSKCTISCCRPQSASTWLDPSTGIPIACTAKAKAFRCPDCLRRQSIRTLAGPVASGRTLAEFQVRDQFEGNFFPHRRQEIDWFVSSAQVPEERHRSVLHLIEDLDSGATFKITKKVWAKYLKLGPDDFLAWAAKELEKPETLQAEAHVETMVLLLTTREKNSDELQTPRGAVSRHNRWQRTKRPENREESARCGLVKEMLSLFLNAIFEKFSIVRSFSAIRLGGTSHTR